jgi:P27 family predicted phage terminase small subunit
MRGRKPKPVEVKIREGNPGKRPLPEPVRVGGVPASLEPPDDLPQTAKDWWNEAVPILAKVGILDTVDRAALEMMATQYARAKQASRVIAEHGHLARGSTGQLVEHPSLATERAAAQMFLRMAEQYALTPVARTRLGIAELERISLQQEIESSLGEPELTEV